MKMSDYQVTNYGICGECRYHECETEYTDKWKVKRKRWVCHNIRSDYFSYDTEYTDSCDEWERKEK